MLSVYGINVYCVVKLTLYYVFFFCSFSVMFERISEDGRKFESKTKEHIQNYANAGLRTLVVAYRELGEEEYKAWQHEFLKAKNSVTADRDTLVDAAANKIERNLILLGATAVEDKLQKGVNIKLASLCYSEQATEL